MMRVYILIASVASVLVLGAWSFYWFEYRPSRIRHDCSWVHVEKDAVPAVEPDYSTPWPDDPGPGATAYEQYGYELKKSWVQKERNGTPGSPAEDYWTAADEDEYKFCLHDKGL